MKIEWKAIFSKIGGELEQYQQTDVKSNTRVHVERLDLKSSRYINDTLQSNCTLQMAQK